MINIQYGIDKAARSGSGRLLFEVYTTDFAIV
jgi:hypothetical protein